MIITVFYLGSKCSIFWPFCRIIRYACHLHNTIKQEEFGKGDGGRGGGSKRECNEGKVETKVNTKSGKMKNESIQRKQIRTKTCYEETMNRKLKDINILHGEIEQRKRKERML